MKSYNSLQDDKILDWFKLKEFADDKLKMVEMVESVLERVETLWEKEKMLVNNMLSFSHNVFWTFSKSGENQGLFGKVLKLDITDFFPNDKISGMFISYAFADDISNMNQMIGSFLKECNSILEREGIAV